MKIRRRFAAGNAWDRLADRADRARERLRAWWETRRASWRRPGSSPRREVGDWWIRDRPFWMLAGIVGASAVVAGYLLAALAFFPAPIFAASHGVPSVIGLPEEEAGAALGQVGLLASFADDRVPHPTIPGGAVVWQDPPPEVLVPEGTEVELTLSAGPQRVPVPDVAGYDAALARTLIESAGLTVGAVEQTQAPTPENVAVNTRPPAGTALLPGSRVALVVSIGAPTIRVPELIGLTLDSAQVLLAERGLTLGENYHQRNSTVAPGLIFFQHPAGGTLTAPGTAVNVRVAREGS